MSYWNPVLSYGVERFSEDLVTAGAQGMITPDLIPDEAKDWIKLSEQHGLDRVFLVAPSSSDARVENNSKSSKGFVYSVSTMGITGASRARSTGSIRCFSSEEPRLDAHLRWSWHLYRRPG